MYHTQQDGYYKKQTKRNKKEQQQELVQMWGNRNPRVCWYRCKMVPSQLKTIWQILKVQPRLPQDPAVPLLDVDPKEWKAETQTDLIILSYFLYLINVDNIFSYTEDPKIKKHIQNIHNTRLYQFTSHKNSMFQAYDFHLI